MEDAQDRTVEGVGGEASGKMTPLDQCLSLVEEKHPPSQCRRQNEGAGEKGVPSSHVARFASGRSRSLHLPLLLREPVLP